MHFSLIEEICAVDNENINAILNCLQYFELQRNWICVWLWHSIQFSNVHHDSFFFSTDSFHTTKHEKLNDVAFVVYDNLSWFCNSLKVVSITSLSRALSEYILTFFFIFVFQSVFNDKRIQFSSDSLTKSWSVYMLKYSLSRLMKTVTVSSKNTWKVILLNNTFSK